MSPLSYYSTIDYPQIHYKEKVDYLIDIYFEAVVGSKENDITFNKYQAMLMLYHKVENEEMMKEIFSIHATQKPIKIKKP